MQKAVENILDTEKIARASFEPANDTENKNDEQLPVIVTPWNQWFQRIFCLPVLQFKHYNNYPQHNQWRSDCDRFQDGFGQAPVVQPESRGMFEQRGVTDPKIYFPDADILGENKS